jgi:hypothetical protein
METSAPFSAYYERDGRAQVFGGPRVPLASTRQIIDGLAQISGLRAHRLVEWISPRAEDISIASGPPPLYYAALLPDDAEDEMPLGLGESPAAALTDLLWTLGGPVLCSALSADDSQPRAVAEDGAFEGGGQQHVG